MSDPQTPESTPPESTPAADSPNEPTAEKPVAEKKPVDDNPIPVDELTPGEAIIEGGEPELNQAIVAAIMTCYDPEIPVDIYQLGLIYRLQINDEGHVDVDMTLTSPNCPVAGTLPGEVEQTIAAVAGVNSALVQIVWDPQWGPERMSEAARLSLGLF